MVDMLAALFITVVTFMIHGSGVLPIIHRTIVHLQVGIRLQVIDHLPERVPHREHVRHQVQGHPQEVDRLVLVHHRHGHLRLGRQHTGQCRGRVNGELYKVAGSPKA